MIIGKERFAQCISIKDTLLSILEDPVVKQQCFDKSLSVTSPAAPNVLGDVCDGWYIETTISFITQTSH